ncbi:lytic transglycosylase domain-containing protein [Alteribacillus sp. HJP-4]
MSLWQIKLAGLILPAVFFISGFDREHMDEHIKKLESDSKELEEIKDIEEGSEFLEKSEDASLDMDYRDWKYAKAKAETMKEESEDRFKLEWGIFLTHQAEKKDIDPELVYELLRVETGDTFDPELTGPETKYGKAYGMAQFMKNTGPWIAKKADMPYKDSDLFNPYYAIQLSIEYLDYLHDKYENWDEALTAYHRGVGGLESYKDKNGDAKSWYAVEIQDNAEEQKQLLAAQ